MAEEHRLLDKHLAEGSLDRAESVARHLLSIEPTDVLAHVALARLEAARGRVDAAEQQLQALVVENPRSPDPLAYLAVLKAHKGDREQALVIARRSIALGGDVAAALVLVADHALEGGEHDEALALYERALRHTPTHSGAWLGVGRILAFRGQLGQAEDAYVRSVQLGPQRVEAWVELVTLEREGGALEVAQENLALALRTHPGHPALIALARGGGADDDDPVKQTMRRIRQRLLTKDFPGAMLDLDRLVESYPSDPRVLLAKADVASFTGKGDTAPLIHELMRITRAEPNAWEPKVALGRLLLLGGPMQNPKLAAAQCEDAWRTSGEDPYAGLALVEAWAAIGKLAIARALCHKLADGEGPVSDIARAILKGEAEGV